MSTITVQLTPEEYRVAESLRLLMELATYAKEDAAAALTRAKTMRVPFAARELQMAVVCLASAYLRGEEEWRGQAKLLEEL